MDSSQGKHSRTKGAVPDALKRKRKRAVAPHADTHHPQRPTRPDPYAIYLEQRFNEVLDALRAARDGDLSVRLDAEGIDDVTMQSARAFNALVERSDRVTREVVRASRAVGREGRAVESASIGVDMSGDWKNCMVAFNSMTGEVAWRTQEVARIINDVANGDLSHKMLLEYEGRPLQGDALRVGTAVNQLVDRLRDVSSEVTRVAREVGTEGKLGGQADVANVSGTWKDLTDNVNLLAGNLTTQVRNIALVTTAVANGDLSQKITVEARGEILELKNTVNTMVDQLRAFATEVTRVAKEVGTEGKLGGQAEVRGVSGTWKGLTDNVNLMATNLTDQVRNIALVTTAVANGDLSQKITVDVRGEVLQLKNTINTMVDQLRTFAAEVTRVAREVGTEGTLGGQAQVPGVAGTWKDLTDNVNLLAGNLTNQVRNIAVVTTAVATGDLSQKITVDAKGEILELKNTVNAMVDQLRTFAREVTRVAREVGTEGKLGGQAQVPGVAGTWQDLTENVNGMASNLTNQVRGIVKVVTAVAEGDLSQKLVVDAKGEIAALAETINNMTGTLRIFAEQVTTVAREVGIEGKLGGQAKVPGASGTWRDLTDNVNQLAGNLTTQVRAISEVASAVTKGNLTRTIDVEAQGEVLSLKDTINQMIANLRDTTQTNKEQDWLKTNLAKFSQMMAGQRSLVSLAQLMMSELTPLVSAQHGTFYATEFDPGKNRNVLRLLGSYAFQNRNNLPSRYEFGEGLVGQCAAEKKNILVADVPSNYVTISSSIGSASPRNILLLPILFEGNIKGVIELGSFQQFSPIYVTFLEQLTLSMGVVFNMISASTRTEELLRELKGSNVELEERTNELEEKATLLEVKNREIAEASASLEEKAKQLALVSKYKSEFLANMSHELRTPLNSLLILAKLLADNEEKNLDDKQVEYAKTIYSAGNDLLGLISQILDLSKIEAGKMQIERQPIQLRELRSYVERSFRQVGKQRAIAFRVTFGNETPARITTDPQRLQQILKNLLSNAFKFTEKGEVHLHIERDAQVEKYASLSLRHAPGVLTLSVTDTGIGIPEEKQQLIFEAFQQADASTSRTYGGTGLGLTISRELSRLLGGEIHLRSHPNRGSVFSLHLPLTDADCKYDALDEGGQDIVTPEIIIRDPARVAEMHARDANSQNYRFDGHKILLVDDDVRNLFAVTCLLERTGLQVLPARSGKEALALLGDNPDIGLVLMDIMMPEMDGFEATREIRQRGQFSNLPIVALTAKAMPGDREKCIEAGCNDFIPKPVQSEVLLSTIARSLTPTEAVAP